MKKSNLWLKTGPGGRDQRGRGEAGPSGPGDGFVNWRWKTFWLWRSASMLGQLGPILDICSGGLIDLWLMFCKKLESIIDMTILCRNVSITPFQNWNMIFCWHKNSHWKKGRLFSKLFPALKLSQTWNVSKLGAVGPTVRASSILESGSASELSFSTFWQTWNIPQNGGVYIFWPFQ